MERMTPEDANAEAWRRMETAMERLHGLDRLRQLKFEREFWPDEQPTRYNPLDFENEIAEALLAFNNAVMRVQSFTEEARLGLIERGDLPAD